MRVALLVSGCATILAAGACGSRTGLLAPANDGVGDAGDGSGGTGSGEPGGDDGNGTGSSGGRDASLDAARIRDALPPLDVTRAPDAPLSNRCPDAASTLVYVVTSGATLLSFDPPTATFETVGDLHCPTQGAGSGGGAPVPFSMAVDRSGVAFVLYDSGELFRVSTATASCRPTRFVPNHTGFTPTFGMGYSSDGVQGGTETLYVAGDQTPPRLGSIDDTTFRVTTLGDFNPRIRGAELTGTGAGDLFAFYALDRGRLCDEAMLNANCPDSAIGQIDKTTGEVLGQTVLSGLSQGNAWAFAFYGGDFYTFTAPNDETIVTRFRPGDGSRVTVARRSDAIVGAGVSTCAPVE